MNKILDFNIKNEPKIFFGKYDGLQRYDIYKYPFAKTIEEKMRNAFWNPNEISMVKDSHTFFELPNHIQEIMKRIWLFQTVMDSGQNRGLDNILSSITTSPEFEAVFKTQGYFELIHSLSYSHILRGIFSSKSTEIFDSISNEIEILHRIDDEIEAYNKTETKEDVLELLINVFALEGIKFYVSFLVTYCINYNFNSSIQGSTRIIKLINFDEDMHTSVFSGLINILRKNKKEGFSELFENGWFENKTKSIFKKVYKQEMVWFKYLNEFGNIPMLTEGVVEQFLKYYIDFRLKSLNVEPIYNVKKSDVVEWFDNYKDISLDNVAQQEGQALAYNIGILKDDITDMNYEWNK